MAAAVLAEPGGVRDAKGVSDSKYVLLVGKKSDYPHRAFVVGAPVLALAEPRLGSVQAQCICERRTPRD